MTGLLESAVRKLSFVWTHDRSVRSFSRLRKSPAGLAFKATEKLDPDVRELLSTHCSWCVLDCGEAQRAYHLYEKRGCEQGHDLDDWFQAEAEVAGKKTAATAESEDTKGGTNAARA
jgi:hypothetical protein